MDIALSHGGFCDMLLIILKEGHYTLRPRADVQDPAYQVWIGGVGSGRREKRQRGELICTRQSTHPPKL